MRLCPYLVATVPPFQSVHCAACLTELSDRAWSQLTSDDKFCGWLCEEHWQEWEAAGRKVSA